MTQFLVCRGLFWGWLLVSKRLDHGSQAVMTQFYSLAWFASGLAEQSLLVLLY